MTAFLGTTLISWSPERSAVLWTTLPVCNSMLLLLLLLLSLLLLLQSHHLCRPQTHCSRAARSGVTASGHTQDSFRIVVPPTEFHRKWRQVVIGLPSEGDTAVLVVNFSSSSSLFLFLFLKFWLGVLLFCPHSRGILWDCNNNACGKVASSFVFFFLFFSNLFQIAITRSFRLFVTWN